MNNSNIPFQTIDWAKIPKTEHKGKTRIAHWQTIEFSGLRIRIVEYSPGYMADHWCEKGHIVHCLEGQVVNEQKNRDRSIIENGVKLMIIDGDFLKFKNE